MSNNRIDLKTATYFALPNAIRAYLWLTATAVACDIS